MRRTSLPEIRPATHADDGWYPSDAETLRRTVERFLAEAVEADLPQRPIGLISPHAGYAYSGPTAGVAYRQVVGCRIPRVILLGPSHFAYVENFAISAARYYATPLGQIRVDKDFAAELAQRLDLPFIWETEEHSLEVQLPFLQVALRDFEIVPILVGDATPQDCRRMAEALTDLADAETCLVVASSDLHHLEGWGSVDRVRAADQVVLAALDTGDPDHIEEVLLESEHRTVCGRLPIITAVRTAVGWGATNLEILAHTNSAEVTGQGVRSLYTVGYAAGVMYRDSRAPG